MTQDVHVPPARKLGLDGQVPVTERRDASAKVDEEAEPKPVGTIVLVAIFFLSFVVYFFANWKALSDVWHVR